MQGRVGAEAAQKFVREIQKKVNLLNLQKIRLQVLMSGRELVVQANANEFRKPQQILHILPYYLPKREREQYEDRQELLAQDQRETWWQNYGKASGQSFTSMPEALRKDNLEEITAQPLLNYLVALSLSRGKIDFSTETNLNAIYQDLLEAIYERGWERRPHLATQGLESDDFFRILEEIALATWHGDGRTTTIRNIENHCQHSGLQPLLDNFQEGAKAGVTRLLTAFYFRQSELSESGDKTFEFTHKSFGEYLTARRIIRATRRIHNNLEKRKAHYEDGWDESQCLEEWAKLCGPSVMDTYLFSFVENEVRLQEKDTVAAWQQTLSHLIGFMLRNGMPMERLNPRPSYREESRQARNAEEALLAALNACACMNQKISQIEWPFSDTDLATWLRKLHPQRSSAENMLALHCLSYLDMCTQRLYLHDLREANLFGANLFGANLFGADLRGANLFEADLREANLLGANLFRANLFGANLREAILHRADLREAILHGADLREAELFGAILHRAELFGAILHRADLREANLREANLRGADLREVNLFGANLLGANLLGANLLGANLLGANLRKANLFGANLFGANLRGANLRGANLRGANLRGADLRGVDLLGADLRGANIRRADLRGGYLLGADLLGVIYDKNSLLSTESKNLLTMARRAKD